MSEPGILPNPIPFGKYYLLERVNVGGMAEIFKAKVFGVEGFERLVAVKKILSSIAEDESFIKMFIDEAKIAVVLNHPNIAQVFELGKVHESYFIAMEYISGKDLKTSFERGRRIGERVDIPRVCYTLKKVCEGLAHAHEKRDSQGNPYNIVHRDISPQNILVSYEGDIKVIDFGIAKAQGKTSQTQVGILKGKFSYMSPEQVRGLHVDHRSDLFSLGIVLYEMLTLERLFLGESDFDTLEKIRKVEMSPPSLYNPHIPKELEDIVLKSLARTPEERFQSADDMAEALEKFMRQQGYFYSNKDLASYMKEAFQADIEFENKKVEYYRTLNLSPLHESPAPAPAAAPARRSRPGLSWGEDEMETQIFDRVGPDKDLEGFDPLGNLDIGPGPATLDNELDPPTVEFQRWTGAEPGSGLDAPFDDDPEGPGMPRPQGRRPTAATSQLPALERRRQTTQGIPRPITAVHHIAEAPPGPRRGPWVMLGVAATVVVLGLVSFIVTRHFKQQSAATVSIATTPADVEILVNDAVVHKGPTPYSWSGDAGPVAIVVRREGYEPLERSAVLEAGKPLTIEETLRPVAQSAGSLRVASVPEGARVEIDGKPAPGVTPTTVEKLAPGNYTLKFSRPGFQDEVRQVTVKGGEALPLDVTLRPLAVAITVQSRPDRSEFTVYAQANNTRVAAGRTPETVRNLAGGQKYRVVIERPGHDSFEQVVEPDGAQPSVVSAELAPAKAAKVELAAAPPDAPIRTTTPRNAAPPTSRTTNSGGGSGGGTSATSLATAEPTPTRSGEEELGTLSVGSTPQARVHIDGQDTGRYTPLINFKIKAGKHKVVLINEEVGLNKTYYVNVAPGGNERIINR